MDFVDRTLVRLANPATRAVLFDQDGLAALAAAAYDVGDLGVSGPYVPVFDELRLGFSVPRIATLDGSWQGSDGSHRTDSTFRIRGLHDGDGVRLEALWRGSIVARARPTSSRIAAVEVERASLAGIDDDVVAALGALPTDSSKHEAARRTQLVVRLKAVAADPVAVTPAFVDAWLEGLPARSATALLASGGVNHTSGVSIKFSPPDGPPPGPVPLPVSVAVQV